MGLFPKRIVAHQSSPWQQSMMFWTCTPSHNPCSSALQTQASMPAVGTNLSLLGKHPDNKQLAPPLILYSFQGRFRCSKQHDRPIFLPADAGAATRAQQTISAPASGNNFTRRCTLRCWSPRLCARFLSIFWAGLLLQVSFNSSNAFLSLQMRGMVPFPPSFRDPPIPG